MSDPKSLGPEGGPVPGKGEIEGLLHSGLSQLDSAYIRQATLAEQVPTVENGLWRLFPDGRMETTWKLRPNVFWHDGTPFTSADVLFTSQVEQDREMTVLRKAAYRWVERIEAPDERTVNDTLPSAISHRIQGVLGARAEGTDRVWSVFQWDVKP